MVQFTSVKLLEPQPLSDTLDGDLKQQLLDFLHPDLKVQPKGNRLNVRVLDLR